MADDAGEKTEQPTARRRQEARESGNVPRSTDLAAAAGLLVGLFLLQAMAPDLFSGMLAITRFVGDDNSTRPESLVPFANLVFGSAGRLLLPFLALLFVLSVVASIAQTGPLVTWKRLKPDLTKLSPLNGLKRIASLDSLHKLFLSLIKLAFVLTVAWVTIRGMLRQMIESSGMEPAALLALCGQLMFTLALRIVLVLLVLGLVDYFYQRWQTEKKLKMTKQEVKDELKRMEGDPIVRQRRRQVQMQLAMQRLAAEVPKADVIVTNPTEFAVALKYDESTMSAPRVLAKGADLLALRIRQLAAQHRIPIVQRPPLARALFAACEVGDEVPPLYYKAVAELLAYVYRITGRLAS